MPAFSLIVPVYNVEDYLPQCLESLRAQTMEDIEIICVNDGSTDNSKQIAEQYAQADDRISVVNKANGGLSSARNVGIRAATGDYLCFIDSDDLILPDSCAILLQTFQNTGADVVTFGATCYPDFCFNSFIEEMTTTRDAVYDSFSGDILFKEHSHPYACRTAVRRSFLKEQGISFDENVPFGEDQVFHFALYPRANKVAFIRDKLYLYRIGREGSLTTARSNDHARKLKEHCNLVTLIAKDWQSLGLMGEYGTDLLDWSVEFLVPPLDELDAEQRPDVFEAIKESWNSWFGDEDAVLRALDGRSRDLAALVYKDVYDDKQFLYAVKHFFTGRTSQAQPTFGRHIKNILKRIAPISLIRALRHSRNANSTRKHAQWYADDAAYRARSLERVKREVTQKAFNESDNENASTKRRAHE
ncbi:glycosyltransferase family 2 protein [Adlercreutzia murintestinalis]|jgi:Glycosyltransferases involved in cell wall biogenesis|uniref:glycosyltransferase family 2 protein n=1 Tax=Adlercreutzia murintestinalis TaxID=2941325 RepID=UPI00204259D9|nr:glycosyltransferase family 2 protein [Adlercreutzia murintestinalis]